MVFNIDKSKLGAALSFDLAFSLYLPGYAGEGDHKRSAVVVGYLSVLEP